ncbi:vang-like protein 1 [Tubulanus polymorphus]|uniref:vang-like protein 1 n=1 Tax=Tubulanus polymorphus TaxID=672921 RepID=UPI003DA5E7F6
MDVESVRSGYSDGRSERSYRSHGSGHMGHRHHRRSRHSGSREQMNRPPLPPGGDEIPRRDEERIEVQILPQDDNWGDNTTAITGATSETGFSVEDMTRMTKDMEESVDFDCMRYAGTILAAVLSTVAFLSPVAMVIMPKLEINGWKQDECGPKCEGLLISFAFKLLILLIGTGAVFFRRPKATMPRIFIFRALLLFLVFLLTFAFWLFYGVRIFDKKVRDYHSILLFSVSLVDALLFIHYLAIILIEIRQLQPQYCVKVVRSPDGETRYYNIGQLSIQRAAVWCLEKYFMDFDAYNPYLDAAPRRNANKNMTGFKIYDVDGVTGQPAAQPQRTSRAIFAAAARKRDSSHNDRFYEEEEYRRRVKKRKARLLTAAEEAFTHIKRFTDDSMKGPAIPMDPQEAAQSIFPSMARALQKYLRITRQQPRYTMESIMQHLATCISYDMSPKAFLEKYITQGPVILSDREYRRTQPWVLICDTLLSRAVEDGCIFQLRQGEVALLCTLRKIPHYSLTEEVIDPKTNKFVLRLNSETSV